MAVFVRCPSRGVALLLGLAMLAVIPVATAAQSPGLKIVVIAGEDAVNIIQQKTAVAPIVEVRDRNDQPVAGAVVTFAIKGGRATFNGARILTVTTNAAGRAAVSGLTPTASGALQISASAAFQGQTAVATITQTNVLTAAQAATAASGAGGSGGGAGAGGAAAGTGGGGMSGTTIGLVGAAIGGGALVATQAGGDDGAGETPAGGGPKSAKYAGTYSGQLVIGGQCVSTLALTGGTIAIELLTATDGTVSGTAEAGHTQAQIAFTCPGVDLNPAYSFRTGRVLVTGTTGSLGFRYDQSSNFQTANGVLGVHTWAVTFTGTLEGNVIVGTWTQVETNQNTSPPGPMGTGSVSIPITLR